MQCGQHTIWGMDIMSAGGFISGPAQSALQELQARVGAGPAWGGKHETPGGQPGWQQQASTNQRRTHAPAAAPLPLADLI